MQAVSYEPICTVAEIPGLYISDITIPRSASLLRQHGITHLLSLTSQRDSPTLENDMGIQHQCFVIEDNPLEDILMSLEGLCAWVDNALATTVYNPKVLVHCMQGVSRSGAVIVALLMRNCSLDYESALALARKSRVVIAPNAGFADQLRIWQKMNFSISEADGVGSWKTKLQYEEWRRNRGILLTKDEEMRHEEMRISMEKMAIKFGLLRRGIEWTSTENE